MTNLAVTMQWYATMFYFKSDTCQQMGLANFVALSATTCTYSTIVNQRMTEISYFESCLSRDVSQEKFYDLSPSTGVGYCTYCTYVVVHDCCTILYEQLLVLFITTSTHYYFICKYWIYERIITSRVLYLLRQYRNKMYMPSRDLKQSIVNQRIEISYFECCASRGMFKENKS